MKMTKFVYENIKLIHGDCMNYMKDLPDNAFDLAIVDPQYGIGDFTEKGEGRVKWNNNIPERKYFKELFRISRDQIISGGNYFTEYLYPTKSWIIWNKEVSIKTGHLECELFWTTLKFPTYILKETWTSGWYSQNQEQLIHPCQKPIKLYKKILRNHAKPDMKIIDTHGGSMSSMIACYDFGCEAVGIEIDQEYYDAAVKRFKNHIAQQKLF